MEQRDTRVIRATQETVSERVSDVQVAGVLSLDPCLGLHYDAYHAYLAFLSRGHIYTEMGCLLK